MTSQISPVDVARACGLSDATVRRYLESSEHRKGDKHLHQKWPAETLPFLVAFCRSRQKRKRLNRFNAVPLSSIVNEESNKEQRCGVRGEL
jgi:hypothetical protein